MKHLSVGEGTGCAFDLAHARLRAEDEKVNEWLNRHARVVTREEMDPPRFCACGEQIHFNSARQECKRCANRRFMRNQRRREPG